MYDFYEKIRTKTFEKVQEELLDKITDENLLKIFSKPEWDTGTIRGCSQDTIHKFYPLVAHKQWEIRYSYFADKHNKYYSSDDKAPIFVDIETYLDWENLRNDKSRFDKEWREHKYYSMHRDSRLFDGNAQIWFNGQYMTLPEACDETQNKYKKRKNLKSDEIAIIMRVYANRDCLNKFEKEEIRDYGTVFVLALVVNEEDEFDAIDERKLIIAKYFKDVVINRYARYLMNQYDEKVIDDWTQKVLNCSIETNLWSREHTTDDLYEMILNVGGRI